MKLKTLTIEGYKGFEKEITIDFAEKTTAIVGVNGSGKTSIIEGISLLVSKAYIGYLVDKPKLDLLSLNTNSKKATINLILALGEEQITGKLEFDNKFSNWFDHNYLYFDGNQMEIIEDYFIGNEKKFPITLVYPTDRGVSDINLSKKGSYIDRNKGIQKAMKDAFASKTNFDSFFEWFKEREDYENEVRLSDDPAFRLNDLNAVRKAVTSFLDDFDDLRVKRHPKVDMVVKKGKTELSINQLSHGEKIVMAMVGDIARRLSLANPKLENVLEGEAIIMIDEIELHLHPNWQRKIIQKLENTFPNSQFIITTHSPQVLSELNHKVDKTILLDNYQVFELPNSYGRDSNWILDILMQVPSRPREFQEKLDKYFRLIDLGKIEEAKIARAELEELFGGTDEPEFIKADLLMRRKLKTKK